MFCAVKTEVNGVVVKSAEFVTEAEAQAHAEEFPGFIVVAGAYRPGMRVDLQTGTVTYPESRDWVMIAMSDLRERRDRLMEVVSGMQSDYLASGDTVNALLCKDVKQGLKDITVYPAIVNAATRLEFNTAVVARWRELALPAPLDVKAEFKRYAG
jgi:hypothetical protein